MRIAQNSYGRRSLAQRIGQGKGLGKVPRMCGGREGDCNAGVFVCECVLGTRSVQSGSGGECSLRGVAAADLVDQPAKNDPVHHPAEPDGCAGASSQAVQKASRSPSEVAGAIAPRKVLLREWRRVAMGVCCSDIEKALGSAFVGGREQAAWCDDLRCFGTSHPTALQLYPYRLLSA